ncbi:MAG: hypothetical protein D3925_19355 [Candidatus Electrothrix sp. AR5]|nr:hypothetical protein [Candidatus Electrothrix sp. AR5]
MKGLFSLLFLRCLGGFLGLGGGTDFFFSFSVVPACGLIRISPNAGGDSAFGVCCSPVMFLDLFYTSALDYQSVNSIGSA